MKNKTDEILEGLTGDFRIGQKYYFFTVTYAYIAVVSRVTDKAIWLDDVTIVSQAGSESDAVTKICHGKRDPEVCEQLGRPMAIMIQALVSFIPMG